MRKIFGGVILVAGVVLMLTAFFFTLGLGLFIVGLLLIFWPAKSVKPKIK
jgi:hypothetical protein